MRGTILLVLLIGAGACAVASGDVKGGDPRSDPQPVPTADAGVARPEDGIDAGSGTTWTDLYRDLFGATGAASCAGNGNCHGAVGQAGEKTSKYVCADKDGCHASLTSASTNLVRPQADQAAPEKSLLVQILRHRTAAGAIAGIMPREPGTYVFSQSSISRVETWIRGGAPND